MSDSALVDVPVGHLEPPDCRGCDLCHKRDGVFILEDGPSGPRWACRDDVIGCMERHFRWLDYLRGERRVVA